MDPVAAKRYKFVARCELNLVEIEGRTNVDACAKQDFSVTKQRVSEMQLYRRQQRRWFTRNPQGVVVKCSIYFVYLFYTLG